MKQYAVDANKPELDRIGQTFFPDSGQVCTRSFSSFLKEYSGHIRLFFFTVELVARDDENRVRAATTLASIERDDSKKAEYAKSAEDKERTLKKLQEFSDVVSQNLTNGIVNAFQRYFSSIISEVCHKRPEVLSSSEQIRVDDVIRISNRRDLIRHIVERKVNELSYGGLSDLEEFFKSRLGIPMFQERENFEMLRTFFEIRNINVHNASIANKVFASRVGDTPNFDYRIGEKIHLDLNDIETFSNNALEVARSIDSSVRSKFKLQCKKHSTWKTKSATD